MATKRLSEAMRENCAKMISAARKAFAERGFSAASKDDLTAESGLTRCALYRKFGDKKGLFAAVIAQIDGQTAKWPCGRKLLPLMRSIPGKV